MISCQDLDKFVDKLCDTSREMDPLERAREIGDLLEQVETVPQRFLMQWRAASVADLYFLHGRSLRDIARELDYSPAGVWKWVQNHGPEHYLTLSKESAAGGAGERIVLRLVRIGGDTRYARALLKNAQRAGRIVVPATMNLVDPEQPDGIAAGVDPEQLWRQLADDSA